MEITITTKGKYTIEFEVKDKMETEPGEYIDLNDKYVAIHNNGKITNIADITYNEEFGELTREFRETLKQALIEKLTEEQEQKRQRDKNDIGYIIGKRLVEKIKLNRKKTIE